MQPVTPRGFRDVLFAEAAERESVAARVSAALGAWGYEPIETPVAEDFRTLEAGVGGEVDHLAFRLIDLDGTLLALRPEMTVPIARVAASRLADVPGPHRIRYTADVFREHASLRGQSRQFTQIGVELIGARGPAADAEVVLALIDALEATGLESFQIGLGTIEVLVSLLAESGGEPEWRDAVIAAAQERNFVELDRLAARDDLTSELARALVELPRSRGGREALDACTALAAACGCEESMCSLRETYRILEVAGYAERVVLDFGIVRSLRFYTGLQIEAYAPGLGLPLAGGGRYDRLLAAFGTPSPAAGFALGLERVMIALAEQGRTPRVAPLDAVLGGVDVPTAFVAAARLRAAGWRVRVAPGRTGAAVLRQAEETGAAEALLAEGERIVRLDRAGEPAGDLGDPVPEPPRLTWAARGGEDR